MILRSTVLIGQHKALIGALVGDLNGTYAHTPRELSRTLDAVVDVVLKCHILRQRQDARRPIPHHVRSLPANLVDTDGHVCRWCVIITGTPNFQGQYLVNMWFICTKISWPRHEIRLREVLPELSTICTAFTV